MTLPEGCRVVLTRTEEDAAAWTGPLEAAGARVISLPCISTEIIDDAATRSALATALSSAAWLILTSRRGVDALARLLPASTLRDTTRIAVVGAATAAAAEAAFGRVDCIGTGGTARALATELVTGGHCVRGQTCVAALAANAGTVLEDTLGEAGLECTRIDIYRTIPHPPVVPRRGLRSLEADAVVFSSGSTVEGFLNQVEIDGDLRAFSIGPSTSAALQRAGLAVTGEAREPGIDGLIEIIATTLNAPVNAAGGREP